MSARMLVHTTGALLAGILLLASSSASAVPPMLTQQGRLLDDSGSAVSGTHTLRFSIYDAESGGAIIWQGESDVDIDETGFYTVMLGDSTNPIDPSVLSGSDAWMALSVDGSNDLEPRVRVTSVPYAVRASESSSVAPGSITSDSLAAGAVTSAALTTVPWSKLINVPAGLDDGDDDVLGGLSCASGDVAQFDGTNWTCTQLQTYGGTDFALSDQTCAAGQIAVGIDASGTLLCDDQPSPYIPGGPAGALASKITVRAKGTCGTSATKPQLALYINRELVNVIDVPNATYSDFEFPIATTYASEIGVGFINDGMSGACDRDLDVASITLDDTITVASTDTSKVFLDSVTFFDDKDVSAATDHLTDNSVLRFMLAPQAVPSVPSGMVAFFPGNCPPGWSEYAPLRGRVAVGVPSGGAVGATVDTALGDQQKRVITQVPAHTHVINPPATYSTYAGNHRHGIPTRQDDYNVSGGSGPSFGADNGAYNNHGHYTEYAGNHHHLVDIPPFTSGSTGPPSVDVSMPYLQLRACQAP